MEQLSQQKILDSKESQSKADITLVSDIFCKLEESTQFYWNFGQSHFFYRPGFGTLHCRYFSQKKNQKLLVIAPGRGESSLKYSETILDLQDKGLDILVLDHRGQGFSERYHNCPENGYIENFQDYIDDFRTVVDHFKERKHYQKTHLLAHSMGAAIGLAALLRDHTLFQGMILCSPMLKIKTLGIPAFMAKFILLISEKIKLGHRPLYKKLSDVRGGFTDNPKTSCWERYHHHLEMDLKHPQIKIGPPTLKWLSENLSLSRGVFKERKKLKLPILLMQAEEDSLVCSKAQDRFAHEVENCRIIRLKNSRHEILSESNDIRNRAFVQIEKFLKENG